MTAFPTANTPAKIATAYLESFVGGDPKQIASHVADDFVNEHTSALGSGCVGRSAYLDRLPGFLTDMAELRYEIEELVVDGSAVAAFYTMTARWQGEAPISIRGVQRLAIVDGLISHRTDYWDSQVFLQQVEAFNTVAADATGDS
ncbi:MAG: nuclear transport factor 2 family protein [Acidimicrobiales bacterium]|nr:nuclear transport factor 2 family protein [Acidimicrobiales bacterium]MDG2219433.1 nuclear transport factor 2 family protein [Acidimicrobiales bacterium]